MFGEVGKGSILVGLGTSTYSPQDLFNQLWKERLIINLS